MILVLQDIYYTAVRDGIKTHEGRLGTKALKALKEGSIVQFTRKSDDTQWVQVQVKVATLYVSIGDMLRGRLQEYLPGVTTVDAGIKTYHGFPWYKANEFKAGMIGFSFDIVYKSSQGASVTPLLWKCESS